MSAIGVDRASCFDVSSNVGLQRVLFAIRNYHRADFAATLQNAEHRSLVLVPVSVIRRRCFRGACFVQRRR